MNTQTQHKAIQWTRVNNDANGNPRWVCHFLNLITPNERGYTYDGEEFDKNKPVHENLSVSEKYQIALKRAKKIGGKKFHNKQYGGGIVFQSYSLKETEADIINALNQ